MSAVLLRPEKIVMDWYDVKKFFRNLNRNYVLEEMREGTYNYTNFPFIFRYDKEVIGEAVKNDGSILIWASGKIKNDRDIVMTAVNSNHYAIKHASKRLQDDKEIALKAVEYGQLLKYVSKRLKNDKELKF